jgi:hypothetical protein
MTTERDNNHQPESKHPYRFYWLTGGLATILAAVIAVVATQASSGSSTSSKPTGSTSSLANPAPAPPSSAGASSPVTGNSGSSAAPSSAQLTQGLLPASALGPGAVISGAGTDLSKIGLICGGSLTGAKATAYETILDNQTGQFLNETLTAWDNVTDASNGNRLNHQAIDSNGSCSVSNSGQTATYTGDYPGPSPTGCSGDQYLATAATLTSPSMFTPYQGFLVGTLCGTVSVVVAVESDLPGVTQQTTDGYESTAAQDLQSAGL